MITQIEAETLAKKDNPALQGKELEQAAFKVIELYQEIKKVKTRNAILKQGKEIGGFWFNEHRTHQFSSVMNTAINLGLPGFRWKNAEGEIVDISIAQAKRMSKVLLDELETIYLGTKNMKQEGEKNED